MNKEEFRKQLFNLPSLLMFALGLSIGVCLILYPLFLLVGFVLLGVLYVAWKKRENLGEMLESKTIKKGNTTIDEKKEKFMKEMEEYMEAKQKKKERISGTE